MINSDINLYENLISDFKQTYGEPGRQLNLRLSGNYVHFLYRLVNWATSLIAENKLTNISSRIAFKENRLIQLPELQPKQYQNYL